ncbi:MAG: TolC family protein [Bacteroidota bacterium]|nr:TolC family protein [Bacteroidota bacterium]
MKTRAIQIILTGILIGFCFLANAQQRDTTRQTHAFTVDDAVNYAKKNSVQVRNALIDLQIQNQSNKEITASALPQLNGTGTLNDFLDIPTSLIPAEFTGGPAGTYIPIKFGTKYNATGGLSISQLLFDGQVFVGLQARSTSLKFYQKQAEVTEEALKVNVEKIYYQLVVGRQQLTTVDANISRFEKLLHDTKEIYKQGFAEQLDIDKVNVQLINLQTQRVKTQNQLDAGNAGLKFLLNMPQKDRLILVDSITEDKLKENVLSNNYNYEDRKEYQLLQLSKKLNEFNIKRYKLSYLPSLSANGNYSTNAQRKKFDFFKGGPWYKTSIIGLSLQVPIFDGFAKRSRINEARLALEKTNNNIEQLEASIENDISQSTLSITSSLVTMDAQKQNMQLAEKVYNSTKLKYEQGLGSNQEISTAQADLVTAQNNYYSSLYDAIIAKIDYLKAAGKL